MKLEKIKLKETFIPFSINIESKMDYDNLKYVLNEVLGYFNEFESEENSKMIKCIKSLKKGIKELQKV